MAPTDLPRDGYGWQQQNYELSRRGLACLSPVHVHMRQPNGPDGTWRVSWIRRSRVGGDDFAAADIPLGETREAYLVQLFGDDQEVARHTLVTPAFAITAKLRRQWLKQSNRARHWHLTVSQLDSRNMAGRAARFKLPTHLKGGAR